MVAKFWWGRESGKRRIHWVQRRRMCKPKCEGGLSFKNLYAFNLALLAKQGRRFFQQPTSLAGRVFKARYFPNSDFMQATVKTNAFYYWRSLAKPELLFDKDRDGGLGMEKRLKKIFVFLGGGGEVWGREHFSKVISPIPHGIDHGTQVDWLLMEEGGLKWKVDLITCIFFCGRSGFDLEYSH
ncbi:hypothetical protein ACFX2F_035175 [Malus domestica]